MSLPRQVSRLLHCPRSALQVPNKKRKSKSQKVQVIYRYLRHLYSWRIQNDESEEELHDEDREHDVGDGKVDEELLSANTDYNLPVSPNPTLIKMTQSAVYNDRNLSFVEKVHNAFETLDVDNVRMPQQDPDQSSSSFTAIFSHPPRGDRKIYRVLKKSFAPFDVTTFVKYKEGKVTAWLLGPKDKKMAMYLLDQSDLNFPKTPANCNNIMKPVAKFINAWPDAL